MKFIAIFSVLGVDKNGSIVYNWIVSDGINYKKG